MGRSGASGVLPRVARYLWAFPTSLLGLACAPIALATRGGAAWVAGALEIHGGGVRWMLERIGPGGAAALTLGHVILGRTRADLAAYRDHEHVHVRQCERWGPLFIPAYLAAGAWAWLQDGDAYADNPFEREAHASRAQHSRTAGGA